VKGVLISGAVALIAALLGTPMFIGSSSSGATGSSSATTVRRRTTPSAARPRWAARSSSARCWSAYLAAHLATLQLPTMSALLVLSS
jgi:hypothetical protein